MLSKEVSQKPDREGGQPRAYQSRAITWVALAYGRASDPPCHQRKNL